MKLVWATVTSCTHKPGLYECQVELDEGVNGVALAYERLTGPLIVGDRVLLNVTAVELGLGTGGTHFVVASIKPSARPQGVAFEDSSGGHIMKLRYSPLQRDVLAVESQESPYHQTMQRAQSLEGVPVVCCGLHSQVPLVAAAVKACGSHLRVGYVMTDQAALALELSNVIALAKNNGLIDVTITTGQSFGGDLEAINLHSGLLAACHVGGCDVIIAGIGPGVVGTGTPFGHGGIAQGEALNAVAVLGGIPIACLRMSFADERPRHQVISHHSLAALETIALAPVYMPIPFVQDEGQAKRLEAVLEHFNNRAGHHAYQFEEPVFDADSLRGIRVTTMGRGYEEDPIFFEAAACAGVVGFQIAEDNFKQQTARPCGGGQGCG